jgi:hypothetical protein
VEFLFGVESGDSLGFLFFSPSDLMLSSQTPKKAKE